jgi:hypothetical protein
VTGRVQKGYSAGGGSSAGLSLASIGQTAVTAEEAAMLADVFGEDGELPAQPLN